MKKLSKSGWAKCPLYRGREKKAYGEYLLASDTCSGCLERFCWYHLDKHDCPKTEDLEDILRTI